MTLETMHSFSSEKNHGVHVCGVKSGSYAWKKGIATGDIITKINNEYIFDVLDYDFHVKNECLSVVFDRQGKKHIVTINKNEEDDIGIEFDSFLMDGENRCKNDCIFCFIDQMPSGMRETLYFKDDDSRLSFLFGNYVTLTNLTEHEINRIITMHISPINISVHTTNPKLRCDMMNNRFAGDSLKLLDRFAHGGIRMNCQLVLCPGINDGEELRRSLWDLYEYLPAINSVAVVPVGITKFRDKLAPLEPFTKEGAIKVIGEIDCAGLHAKAEHGSRVFYAADEFYLKAEIPFPQNDHYEDYSQLENGVGMMTLTASQFDDALVQFRSADPNGSRILVATGSAAFPFMNNLVAKAKQLWCNVDIDVIEIKNRFFGETITVAGLITGNDLLEQITQAGYVGGKDILLIPRCMLRFEGDLFLDDVAVDDVSKKLKMTVVLLSNDGLDILEGFFL